jgi:hypothetical protein
MKPILRKLGGLALPAEMLVTVARRARLREIPWLSGDLWAETPRAPSDLLLSGNLSQITRPEDNPPRKPARRTVSTTGSQRR